MSLHEPPFLPTTRVIVRVACRRQLPASPHVVVGCAKLFATQETEAAAAASANLKDSTIVQATPHVVAGCVFLVPAPTPRARAHVSCHTLLATAKVLS